MGNKSGIRENVELESPQKPYTKQIMFSLPSARYEIIEPLFLPLTEFKSFPNTTFEELLVYYSVR